MRDAVTAEVTPDTVFQNVMLQPRLTTKEWIPQGN